MRYLTIIALFALILTGCRTSIDTTNFTPTDRLTYALSLYNDEDYEEALAELQAIILQYPGDLVVDDAQYYLGMTRYQRGEYILAAYEFSKLINQMTASEYLSKAQYQLAECYYLLSPDYSLDQKYTNKAIQEFQSFVDFFPTDTLSTVAEAKIKELNEKLALKEFNAAYIYEKLEYYNAAISYYNNVIEVYHDTKYAPLASYKRLNLLITKKRYNDAYFESLRFLQNYPNDPEKADVESIKKELENKLAEKK